MAGRVFSRDTIMLVLAAVMAVCLVLTFAVGAVSIAWSGRPEGDTARMVAAVFAWLFTAAFLSTFVLAASETRHQSDRRASPTTSSETAID